VFAGQRGEKSGDDGKHYYEIRGGKLIEIKSVQERRTVK
jgi:hypothetical protein